MTTTYHRASDYRPPAGFLPYATRDVAEALPDFFRMQIGVPVRNANPIAESMVEDGVGLAKLARHWLAPYFPADDLRAAPNADVIVRAVGTSDFQVALTSGWNSVVQSTFNEQISGFRAILRDMAVRDFNLQNTPDFGGIGVLKEMPEHAEWKNAALYASTVLEQVRIGTHGIQFTVSRQALINDAIGEVTAAVRQLSNVAALHLAASVASTLEDTTTLSDGSQYFATAKNNLVQLASGGGAPSVTTLDTAGVKLWRRAVGDHIAGVAPRYLVCPPEISHTARVLAAATWDPAGTAGTVPQGRFDVVTLPHLSNTADWYLLGDPAFAPALALMRLAGSRDLVTMEQINTPINHDGLTYRLRLDFKVARVSRVGAVKIKGA